jgi:hypothetical protein
MGYKPPEIYVPTSPVYVDFTLSKKLEKQSRFTPKQSSFKQFFLNLILLVMAVLLLIKWCRYGF